MTDGYEPDDFDPIDGLADALEQADHGTTSRRRGRGQIAYCTHCGADLTGLSIGMPCPQCGVPVGTAGVAQRTSGKAIASMVLGICSIPACFCYGILSIILGIVGVALGSMANKEIARGGYSESSRGFVMAGMTCSWIGILLGVGYILLILIIIGSSMP